MTINYSAIVTPLAAAGSIISTADFGMNMVLGYERFGTLPWEKFDEVQSVVGSQALRFPGGSEAEMLFNYANPNATSVVAKDGTVKQLIATDDFLDYSASTGSRATIVLPVMQLLNDAKYGARDFDSSLTATVRAYIAHVLEKSGPEGIATFELGNEYESYMTSIEYGRVASTLASIAHQEIEKYYAAHSGHDDFKPEVAVQVWGQSQGGTYSLSDLSLRNHLVMAEFSADELAAITAVTSHFYYDEGVNVGKPNYHTYFNIDDAVGYSVGMMNDWQAATGRPLETIFSEWNVNKGDTDNYGLQQIPVLLELFTNFTLSGVDQLDIWATMYTPTSLANYQGNLQASGVLFQLMAHELVGMQATEVPVASADFDIHAFSGQGRSVVFVSSLIDQAMTLNLDLSQYLDHYDLASARLMRVDLAHADGVYKDATGLSPWEETDAPILLTGQDIANYLVLTHYMASLGAHETLVLVFDQSSTVLGSALSDVMAGQANADRIDALGGLDEVKGMAGNDSLFGGSGNDNVFGGSGSDLISGGDGNDRLLGGDGNDTLEGKVGSDIIGGGKGNDFLISGNNSDTLTGGAGADAFVFESGQWGTDLITDFSSAQKDYLVYDGNAVTASDFHIEIRSATGVGGLAADIIVHFGEDGTALWMLQDAGNLTSLTLQDASNGNLISLI